MEKGQQEGISTVDFEDSVNVDIHECRDGSTGQPGAETATPTDTKIERTAKSCPVEGVTVFLDRAEVKRRIDVHLGKGKNEITVTQLPEVMDEDSLRVTCLGEAKIIEVSHKVKQGYHVKKVDPNPEETAAKKKSLEERKEELLKTVELVQSKAELLNKEKLFLASFGNRLGPNDRASEKLVESFDKKSMDSVAAFISFYHTQGQLLCEKLIEARSTIISSNAELEKINKELEDLEKLWGESSTAYYEKEVIILLEAERDTELCLLLSYVVKNASWSPLYDLRAFSEDNSLQLFYFGKIKQSTGEDWNDASISLSTAMPSVGGTPPDLEVLHISTIGHYRKAKRTNMDRYSLTESGLDDNLECSSVQYGLMENEVKTKGSFRMSFGSSKAAPERSYIRTNVKETMTSTSFEIARKSTIKSDDVGHKVSIGVITFKPSFEYEAVPKLVPHAYLTAKVKNNSNYALLAGPAYVFLDNNFLTKSYMDAVSPQEEFEVSLGIDPSVKITYKPVNKFEKKSGLVTKYKQIEFRQEIVIKNTKSSAVKIKITDQLPKSMEEKLKVNLIEPNIPVPKHKNDVILNPSVRLTDKNHVEWKKEISAQKTLEISLKYVVEFPYNVDISLS